MKIALCLSGHLRTYEKTYENIYEQLYRKYDVDTFISTWKNLGNNFAYHADYIEGADRTDPIVDIDTIKKIYNPISIVMDDANTEKMSNNLKKEYEGIKTRNGAKMSQIMVMLYKIWDANRLRKEYQEKNNINYDIVIRLRPDISIKKINLDMINNQIHFIPAYMGVQDFMFVGPQQMMDDVCDIYTIMSPKIPFIEFENIENMWYIHLINNNIPFNSSYEIFDYVRYTINGMYDSKGKYIG